MNILDKRTPALRFPEFEDDWCAEKLGDNAKISSGGTPSRSNSTYWGDGYPWVTTSLLDFYTIYRTEESITEFGLNNSSAKVFPVGTILMAMYGQGKTRGKVGVLGIEAATNQACAAILIDDSKLDSTYLFHNLAGRYNEIRNLSNTGGQENLSAELIKSIPLSFPSLPEQRKIATFFTALDEKIQQISKTKDLLAQYKKGVMQKIFSQEIRFNDDNGNDFAAWEVRPLSNYLMESKLRNIDLIFKKEDVLSVSGDVGIVNQIEHLGRSYAGESVHNYHIVEVGDIVYTKSPLKSNPYGIIKVNRGKAGIVSTLYAVYRCKSNIIGEFLDYYFQIDDNTNKYLRPLVRKGAKNDMKVNNAHVLTGYISVPSIPEQEKIVTFFTLIDEKINLIDKRLRRTKEFKKGLFQQMFI